MATTEDKDKKMTKMTHQIYLELIEEQKQHYTLTKDKKIAKKGRETVGELISYIRGIYNWEGSSGNGLTSEEMALRFSLGFDMDESRMKSLEHKLQGYFK